MLIALLLLFALITARFSWRYATLFRRALDTRHGALGVGLTLFDAERDVLALNDADLYASWRLARVNGAMSTLGAAAAVVMAGYAVTR